MEGEDDEMLTAKQTMAELRISHATLYNWINQGKLTRVKQTDSLRLPRVLFKRSDIDRIKAEDARRAAEQARE
jgi:predicted site-specific integrase-resolvase